MTQVKYSLLLLIVILTSCSVSDRIVLEDAEGVVSDAFFKSIKRNKTQKKWVIDNLGPAHTRDVLNDDIEALTYYFQRTRFRRTSVLFILNFNGSESEQKNYHVLLCNNTVKKVWFDALENVDVARQAKKMRCLKKEKNARSSKESIRDNAMLKQNTHTDQLSDKSIRL